MGIYRTFVTMEEVDRKTNWGFNMSTTASTAMPLSQNQQGLHKRTSEGQHQYSHSTKKNQD